MGGYKVIRAIPTNDSQVLALRHFANLMESSNSRRGIVQFWQHAHASHSNADIFADSDSAEKVLDFLDNNWIWRDTIVANYGDKLKSTATELIARSPEKLEKASDFDSDKYHQYDTIISYLRLLAENNSDFISFNSIGKSYEGREIPYLKFGKSAKNGQKKPIMLVDAGIHAREWIAPAVALKFIDSLASDNKYNSILDQLDIYVIPAVNPDGYEHTWTSDRLWRKTRSGPRRSFNNACSDSDEAALCYGTDPNRNFPYRWGEVGTSGCPCSEVFHGDNPLSEPECANLASFMHEHLPQIDAYLTLHSYSNVLMHGCNHNLIPEWQRVGNEMANAIEKAGGEHFKVGCGDEILYAATGSSRDYAQSVNIKYVYTMELTSGHFNGDYVGFVYPEKGINKLAKQILPALQILAEEVSKMT
ncbi:hypothetical protein niasHS_008512 [Heterodera schachtii]|uniref:Peptidase M14 domain-containing protein n=2 Tax=Heterodera TaxID=34509 RepID=A0ABD2JEY3_HETSC